MTPLREMVLISEILLQAIALRVAKKLKAANEEPDRIEIWSTIQSLLVAAGNVSKILWPREKNEFRGKGLK